MARSESVLWIAAGDRVDVRHVRDLQGSAVAAVAPAVPGAVVDVTGAGRCKEKIDSVRIGTVARDLAYFGHRRGNPEGLGRRRRKVELVAGIGRGHRHLTIASGV